jgi:hypothetical protein
MVGITIHELPSGKLLLRWIRYQKYKNTIFYFQINFIMVKITNVITHYTTVVDVATDVTEADCPLKDSTNNTVVLQLSGTCYLGGKTFFWFNSASFYEA